MEDHTVAVNHFSEEAMREHPEPAQVESHEANHLPRRWGGTPLPSWSTPLHVRGSRDKEHPLDEGGEQRVCDQRALPLAHGAPA